MTFNKQFYFIKETPTVDYKVMWNVDEKVNTVIETITQTDPEDGRLLNYEWYVLYPEDRTAVDRMVSELLRQGYTRI
jgi:hypothetical protein